MVPAITKAGRSFKGAALYYLHDKREEGEDVRLSTDRVAWTEILNLPTDDPELAWRMMADTAECQAALKKAAGVKASGRKLENPVLAFSLAWHPDERPTPEQQLQAAREALHELGLEDHQAFVVAHRDRAHPHVHVVVNRVSPHTGIAAKLSKSKLVLSRWAEGYEQRHGRIFCRERVENNARRKGERPGRAAENRVRRDPRPVREAAGTGRPATAETARDHAERFTEQAATERQGQRRRKNEKDGLHKDRRQTRQATRDREQAAAEAARDPGKSKNAARLAELLMKANPALSLDELTRHHSTFTRRQLARMVGRFTKDDTVFKAVLDRLETSPDLVAVGRDDRGEERFTTRAQQEIERRMERHARLLHANRGAGAAPQWNGQKLSAEQDKALRHVLGKDGLAAVIGFAGAGKTTMLAAARASWEAAGYRVRGAALSGIASDGLATGAGIDSRTIHSRLFQWDKGQNKLTAKDVLVIDEAGMIGTRMMERLLAHALEAKAKVVLVGDAEQLQAIEAGAAFRAIVERVGAAELRTVRRQKQDWQKEATHDLATARTREALRRYEAAGMVHGHERLADAKAAVIEAWAKGRIDKPAATQIILAFLRQDVRELNELARAKLKQQGGVLGRDHEVKTASGKRLMAAGDRLYFLKNDTRMGVRNGSLGTVESIHGNRLTVKLDGEGDRRVVFTTGEYAEIDHGYAATIHKSQGVTVDRAHLLASRNLDRHSAYVAMTRHRERLDVHWSKDRFRHRSELDKVLGRKAAKDTSLDYGEEIEAAREARRQAAEEMRERVNRRARAYAEREKTAAGRMKNARSLAGAGAGLMDVARLALNARARSVAFRQQQSKLRNWARKTAPAEPEAKVSAKAQAKPGRGDRNALAEHDLATVRLAEKMSGRHAAEIAREQDLRHVLARLAASVWRQQIRQAATEQGLEVSDGMTSTRGTAVAIERDLSRSRERRPGEGREEPAPQPSWMKPPGWSGPGF